MTRLNRWLSFAIYICIYDTISSVTLACRVCWRRGSSHQTTLWSGRSGRGVTCSGPWGSMSVGGTPSGESDRYSTRSTSTRSVIFKSLNYTPTYFLLILWMRQLFIYIYMARSSNKLSRFQKRKQFPFPSISTIISNVSNERR